MTLLRMQWAHCWSMDDEGAPGDWASLAGRRASSCQRSRCCPSTIETVVLRIAMPSLRTWDENCGDEV